MFVLFLNQALHDFSSFLFIVFISTEKFQESIIMLHKISMRSIIIYTIPAQKIQLVEECVKVVAYLTVLHSAFKR